MVVKDLKVGVGDIKGGCKSESSGGRSKSGGRKMILKAGVRGVGRN